VNTTTFPGADCGSDHQLLVTTLKLRFKRVQKPTRVSDLRRVNTIGFKQAVTNKIMNLPQDDMLNPNLSWNRLKKVIVETAKENMLPRGTMKDFITPETANIILERRKLKEKGLISQGDHRRYSELSAKVQRFCRRDKTNQINKICAELERHSVKNETKDLFQKVKDLTRTRTVKISAVRDEGGVLVTETKQVLERWKQYCSALYEHDFADERTQDWNSEDLEPDILRSEVELAMSSLKIGKSPGNDAIPAELIKKHRFSRH
ncbi:jg23522, partial [Pararge aegeria aegeria]